MRTEANVPQRDDGDESHVAGILRMVPTEDRIQPGIIYVKESRLITHARKYSQAYRYDLDKGKKSQ